MDVDMLPYDAERVCSTGEIACFPNVLFSLAPDLVGKVTVLRFMNDGLEAGVTRDVTLRRDGFGIEDAATGQREFVNVPRERTAFRVMAGKLVEWHRAAFGQPVDCVERG